MKISKNQSITPRKLTVFTAFAVILCAALSLQLAFSNTQEVLREIRMHERQALFSALRTGPVALAHLQAALIAQEHLDRLMNGEAGFGVRGVIEVSIRGGPLGREGFSSWKTQERDVPEECREVTSEVETPQGSLYPFIISATLDRCFYAPIARKWFASGIILLLGALALCLLLLRWIYRPVLASFELSRNLLGRSGLPSEADLIPFTPLRELTYQALESQRLRQLSDLSQLATQISHDIRAPIAAIDVAARRSISIEPEARELIQSALEILRNLSNQLLRRYRESSHEGDLSTFKLAKGNSEKLVNVGTLIHEAVETFRSSQDTLDQAELVLELPKLDQNTFINFEKTDFLRAIWNLLQNAVDATIGRPNPSVRVRLEAQDSEVLISVVDNGKGIPEELMEKVLLRGGTFGKVGGNGLGLSFAKKAFETWGGALTLESSVGVGTSILIRVPRAVSW
jgi:signal transduction histidine kinase